MEKQKKKGSVVYLSTFPPRECGIATFTKDLTEAIQKRYNPALTPRVVVLDNESASLPYLDPQVVGRIATTRRDDYIAAAEKINAAREVKLVHIQHEFGILGGLYGRHLIPFLQTLEKPAIVTFHSVLPNPTKNRLRIIRVILRHAKAVIVMNEFSKRTLEKEYGAQSSQVLVIPHGIPHTPFPNKKNEKRKLGLQRRIVLSTFGLLGPGKGIEYALRSLPKVLKRFPNIFYLIIGITHPVVRARDGERYRDFLEREIRRLHLEHHVKFYNKFLSTEELLAYLKSTDIYLAPTMDRRQSVSGTLSYAVGCGKPVIATDSLYAKSLVSKTSGILVHPQNPNAIANALLRLCSNAKLLDRMSKHAYERTRHMTWTNVALAHFNLYRKIVHVAQERKLPPISLQHLKTLTDDFGIFQFAKYTKPNKRYGYTLDDNARALIVAAMNWNQTLKDAPVLFERYLDFIEFVQKANGSFSNIVTSQRKIQRRRIESEDAQGRTLWSLGFVIAQSHLPSSYRKRAAKLFHKAMPSIKRLKSPRAIAFAMLGLHFYNLALANARSRYLFKFLADLQLKRFQEAVAKDWCWFEDRLTYSNSKLPESLFLAYLDTKNPGYLEVAEKTFQFLIRITFKNGMFAPIGQKGWYVRGRKRTYFDQQPEDASSMVQTLLVAYQATGKEKYKKMAFDVFQWFLGKNHLHQMVYDESSGGCYDGVGEHALNLNQGAESTVSYLLARLALEKTSIHKS